MVRKAKYVKMGYLLQRESEAGVRALIVAMKETNISRAKEGRKVNVK